MTEEQLQEHGYPRPHPEMSGHAVVHNLPEKKNTDRRFYFDGLDQFLEVACSHPVTKSLSTRWHYVQTFFYILIEHRLHYIKHLW